MLGGRHGRFNTDTFFASNPTLRQCKMVQLFTNDIGYTKVYPMCLKSEISDALVSFLQEVGIPQTIHADNAKELMEGKFHQICQEYTVR
jgi:hypothetical protein